MSRRSLCGVVLVVLSSMVVMSVSDAWARAQRGGSRGSRSYSAPARPSSPAQPSMPASPSRSLDQPAPAGPGSRPGLFGGLMGGIAGFALGGLLGGLLFGGLGHGFGAIGLMDILLIGGGILLLMAFLRRRREASQPAYATAGGPSISYAGAGDRAGAAASSRSTATMEAPAGLSDLERGLAHIRQMDPSFDPADVAEFARSVFHGVQGAVRARDLGSVEGWLTPEMLTELRAQCDQLRSARRTNHVERIAIRRADVTEAWQEGGRDYVTVLVAASLLDYVVDDVTGAVVEGSRTAPQEVEEFWTFARPVGKNAWQLSAIQS
jgi:predicted lipid-binding transport protein (Tim44 family)